MKALAMSDQQETNQARHVHLRVWGEMACFTRPELKVERLSYPTITPSAARGILEAVLYRPEFRWRISRIAVCRPIRYIALRRNEVSTRATSNLKPIDVEAHRTQRNTVALRDVEYVLEASLELTSRPTYSRPPRAPRVGALGTPTCRQYYEMFCRRARKGQCFCQPSLGCREFAANFELVGAEAMEVAPDVNPDALLGWMLFDVFNLDCSRVGRRGKNRSYPEITFFSAALQRGVLVEQGQTQLPTWSALARQLDQPERI